MAASPKREAIWRTGRALLLRHGIRKVRVEEICADAEVSKRTFYKYYRNKDELAVAVLAEVFEQARARVEAVLALDCPIEDKVRQIIAVKSRLASETSAAFYRDARDARSAPGRFALRAQRTWDERVRRFYRDAQARGQIRADVDVDVLMILLVRTRELVSAPELMRLVPDFAQRVEMIMKVFFYGIVPRPDRSPKAGSRRARRKQ